MENKELIVWIEVDAESLPFGWSSNNDYACDEALDKHFKRVVIPNLEGLFFEAIEEVKSNYPTDIFPEDSNSSDAKGAKMARITCDNIKRIYLRIKAENEAS